jgi:hypothetical protein
MLIIQIAEWNFVHILSAEVGAGLFNVNQVAAPFLYNIQNKLMPAQPYNIENGQMPAQLYNIQNRLMPAQLYNIQNRLILHNFTTYRTG